jgi:stearoyl-CoA desaturase (delta-9 desaturase)
LAFIVTSHGSFKAKRGLRVALAVAGSLAVEGSLIEWVADHRRHHAFADREGDPHSPWRYGASVTGLAKGLFFAHCGWLFRVSAAIGPVRGGSDRDRTRVAWIVCSRSWRWCRCWAAADRRVGDVVVVWRAERVLLGDPGPHRSAAHVTWSIKLDLPRVRRASVRDEGHGPGGQLLAAGDHLDGESWHNSHHADPTCARHGVSRGQVDPSARLIWAFERAGWAYDVRWPVAERFEARRLVSDPA